MENLKAVKERIKTVDSIVKAVNAMKMVSTVKLARIGDSNRWSGECCQRLRDMLLRAVIEARFNDALSQDFWTEREGGESLVIVLSTDQGFCGSFNQLISSAATEALSRHKGAYVEVFGKKCDIETKRPADMPEFAVRSRLDMAGFAATLVSLVREYVLNRGVSSVSVISCEKKNAMTQVAQCTEILPLDIPETQDVEYTEIEGTQQDFVNDVFEMYITKLFTKLVTEHLTAEFSARVMAMDNSVRNANDMGDKLRVLCNRVRQARITQELTEIVASVECAR